MDDILRFLKRKETLESACAQLKASPVNSKKCIQKGVANNLNYVKQKEMLYCSIEKTGSTFWKRILHIAGGWRNVSNPTEIGLGEAYVEKGGYRTLKDKTWADIVETFNHTKSIIFVRNPYTRLFSGWLDKFYSPNTYYWKSAGRHIIKTQRNKTSDAKCGYDVSFAEFVNATIDGMLSSPCLDGHFQSNYLHCLPCNLSFDYIGKYESIKQDTVHLLDVFGLSDKIKFSDFEQDAAMDAIRDGSRWVFSQRKSVTEDCGVPFVCALFRVWNRLQSRGIISYNIKFPYNSNEEIKNVTEEVFENVLTNAFKRSNVDDLKNSRDAALMQALGTLPKSTIDLVQKVFQLDFEIFGYDRLPVVTVDPTNFNTFSFFQNCPSSVVN